MLAVLLRIRARRASLVMATFTAPEVSSQSTLTFRLTVTDEGGLSDSATVIVTVNPISVMLARVSVNELSRVWVPVPLVPSQLMIDLPLLDAEQHARFAELWLLVQPTAMRLNLNVADEVTLLDQIRDLVADPYWVSERAVAKAVLSELRLFAADRDPALTAWAQRRCSENALCGDLIRPENPRHFLW